MLCCTAAAGEGVEAGEAAAAAPAAAVARE
jgi:hypothetical protein